MHSHSRGLTQDTFDFAPDYMWSIWLLHAELIEK